MAEERDVSNNVTKRFFPRGEQQSGTNYYYTKDHLGSVREMLNSSGSIVARYSYDPYGRTTLASGSNLATYQFAGTYAHQASGLEFAWFRAYDSSTARWLNRDPIAEKGGLNLYEYCYDDPERYIDPTGLYAPAPIPPILIPRRPEPVPVLIVQIGILDVILVGNDIAGLIELYRLNRSMNAKKSAIKNTTIIAKLIVKVFEPNMRGCGAFGKRLTSIINAPPDVKALIQHHTSPLEVKIFYAINRISVKKDASFRSGRQFDGSNAHYKLSRA